MSFIRTVLGDIASANLGVCYAHEHIIIDASYVTGVYPEFLLDSVESATEELKQFYAAGGRAMVDSMPADSGRNVLKLAEISRGSGVHIIAPTGLHLAKYYPSHHWSESYTVDELADLFTSDITHGIDARDYSGPIPQRTEHRAGVIKIASDTTFTAREERLFEAAAHAHLNTGCPILTHTENGTLAIEQIERLRQFGVALGHVCLSHTDRKPDLGYHREILASGVKIELDSAFRWKSDSNPTLELCATLLPEFPDQIMLGMDAARRSYWTCYGGEPGLTFLLCDFVPRLKDAGLTNEDLERIFVSTPAATYSFCDTR